MTNEQLQILMLNVVSRLEKAIEEADAGLENVPRHKGQIYTGKASMSGLAALCKKNPEDWKETEEMAIALDPIAELAEELRLQAQALFSEVTLGGPAT